LRLFLLSKSIGPSAFSFKTLYFFANVHDVSLKLMLPSNHQNQQIEPAKCLEASSSSTKSLIIFSGIERATFLINTCWLIFSY